MDWLDIEISWSESDADPQDINNIPATTKMGPIYRS